MNIENEMCTKGRGKILVPHFWDKVNTELRYGDDNLYANQLAFVDYLLEEGTTDIEFIFKENVEQIGLNLMFYWVDDGCMYVIYTEEAPLQVKRLPHKKNCEGLPVELQFGDEDEKYPETWMDGEVVARYDNDAAAPIPDLWNTLRIRDVPIGEVLKRSVIIAID